MSIWETYHARMSAIGSTQRQAALIREKHVLDEKMKNSLSYQHITIDGADADVSIIDSDNLNEKKVLSRPGETLDCGATIYWRNNYWLITERDASDEVYTRAKMIQCNHKLKWVDESGEIHEQWCVIEDGTKYMTGDLEDRDFIVTRGDSRIAMTIPKNIHTQKFNRNNRFIICDTDSVNKIAYALTKPLMVGHVYNGKGVYVFLLSECVTTEYDNLELCIADYYKHFTKESGDGGSTGTPGTSTEPTEGGTKDNKRSWL